jgi:GWxTD domain-containing protein
MKKISLLLLTTVFSFSVHAERLGAFFAANVFNQPSGSPYIEAELSVSGHTVLFVPNATGKLQGKIEVVWVLKKDSQIVASDKYNLLSPELADANSPRPDFIDVKRIPASEGNYTLELSIADKNSSEQAVSIKQPLSVSFPEDRVSISDIELIESYTKTETAGKFSKSGFDIVPYASDFYHEGIKSISFYAEVYNAKKFLGDDDFLVTYRIFNDGNKRDVNDLVVNKKQHAQDVNVVLATLPLENVPSGNYDIGIEVRDKKNQLIAHKHIFFQRSNAVRTPAIVNDDYSLIDITNTFVANYTNTDSLKSYIDCLYPISSRLERNIEDNQMALKEVKSMQQFIYYFWSKRDATNPEQKWIDYKSDVDKANVAYKTHNKKGYETDRGRVYLQYGPPNSIDAETMNDDSYPYEIWHYYTVGKESNRKFVFYSRDRSSNNYVLLHSDVLGEVNTYDWQKRLHEKSDKNTGNIDETGQRSRSGFGDNSQDNFNLPK